MAIPTGMGQEASSFCSAEGLNECLSTNQVCTVVPGGDNELCTACLPGFVELDGSCLDISNELTVEVFLSAFPNATFDTRLRDVELEQRLVNLQRIATFISETNRASKPYQLGLNEMSAESLQERALRNGFRGADADDASIDVMEFQASGTSGLPAEVDWVKEGMVTLVKNQLFCGCCWSVAAIGAIESKYLIDMAKKASDGKGATDVGTGFSFQQLISCDDDNSGCDGGITSQALQYAHDNLFGGVAAWIDYPYVDRLGTTTDTCQLSGKEVAYRPPETRKVLDRRDKLTFQERLTRMKEGLVHQPVAVAMKANCDLITSYKSGVLTEDGGCACSQSSCLDHAVLMVGYNDTHDPPYFLVKNSWGQLYGEGGYFRVAQTAKGDYGLFGLLSEGYFPSTDTEFDEAKDPLDLWQVILISIGCVVAVALVYYVLEKLWRSRHSNDQEGNKDEHDVEG